MRSSCPTLLCYNFPFFKFLGDHGEQTYRLQTFKDYPKPDVDIYSLSKQGFYYTGYKDRVKCFRLVENKKSHTLLINYVGQGLTFHFCGFGLLASG